MKKENNPVSEVHIQKRNINPDGVTLSDKVVVVKNHDVKVCEKIARDIFKEELK